MNSRLIVSKTDGTGNEIILQIIELRGEDRKFRVTTRNQENGDSFLELLEGDNYEFKSIDITKLTFEIKRDEPLKRELEAK